MRIVIHMPPAAPPVVPPPPPSVTLPLGPAAREFLSVLSNLLWCAGQVAQALAAYWHTSPCGF